MPQLVVPMWTGLGCLPLWRPPWVRRLLSRVSDPPGWGRLLSPGRLLYLVDAYDYRRTARLRTASSGPERQLRPNGRIAVTERSWRSAGVLEGGGGCGI